VSGVAAACSTDEQSRRSSRPTAIATAGPLPLEGVRPLGAAEFEVTYQAPLVSAGWSTHVAALDGSGSALLTSSKVNPNDPLALGVVRLSIAPAGSHTRIPIPSPRRTQPQQVSGGAMNERWAVWQEEPGTDLESSAWTMYAYDRDARTISKLAQAPKIDGRDPLPVPGYTGPTLSGDHVFWAQAEGHVGAETANIYGCEIADCTPERYATAAAYPVAVGDHLYVVARDPSAKPKAPWERFTIEKIDIATRKATVEETIELEPEQSPGGLAVSERALAWIVNGRPDVITIRDRRSGRTTIVDSEFGDAPAEFQGGFGYPVATDHFVAWGESMGNSEANVGNYLFRFDDQTLHSVSNASGLYGVDAAGSYLSWRDSTDPADPHEITVTVARLK